MGEIIIKQNETETLSYCGIYCGGCKNYKENMNCMGCRYENKLLNDCPTRSCAIEKGLFHCGECDEFPCTVLNDFYNDGVQKHEVAYNNMLRIKEIGSKKWLNEQKTKHTCKCGNKIYWFSTKCSKCKEKNN